MRRFDLVLPQSLDDCLKILAQRGDQAKLVAGMPAGGPSSGIVSSA